MDKRFNIDRHSPVLHSLVEKEKDPLKSAVLKAYLAGDRKVCEISSKFHVSTKAIYEWLRIFAAGNPEWAYSRPHASRPHAKAARAAFASPTSNRSAMAKKQPTEAGNLPDDPEELKKRIKELELKLHSREVMIDVAEEMFGIQIRKKPGVKQ